METKEKRITISELLKTNYNINANYQRGDAWSKSNKSKLIDSVMNGYYVPSLIVANDEIVDGKQRFLTFQGFNKNEIAWKYTKKEDETKEKKHFECKYYKDLDEVEQQIFNNFKITVVNLGDNVSSERIKEIFFRINKGTIKLNKIELILAEACPENRNLVQNIINKSKLEEICSGKLKEKRFSRENIIVWCISILTIRGQAGERKRTQSVRDWTRKVLKLNLKILGISEEKIQKTIELMSEIIGNSIHSKNFKTLFSTIFCAFYRNYNSYKCFKFNKDVIKQEVMDKTNKIIKSQMGGGAKYDSILNIENRINEIDEILKKYLIDSRRNFSSDDRKTIWEKSKDCNGQVKCEICKNVVYKIEDCEIDHIIPHACGGKTILDNARVLCKTCNSRQGGSMNKK